MDTFSKLMGIRQASRSRVVLPDHFKPDYVTALFNTLVAGLAVYLMIVLAFL